MCSRSIFVQALMQKSLKTYNWRRILWGGLVCGMLCMLAVFICIAVQIDDWSRDLTTNYAETHADASDPRLRSLRLKAKPEEIRRIIAAFTRNNTGWELVDSQVSLDESRIKLIHITPIMRFVDDVQIILRASPSGTPPSGTLVDISSHSRVGKADLGQNPRNIYELYQALREQFAEWDLED